MEINLQPKHLIRPLLLAVVVLTVLNIASLYFYFQSEGPAVDYFSDYFDFDYEGTIPAFFSAGILLLCSLALAIHAWRSRRHRDGNVFHWAFLSAIFCFLAIDEAVMIHENFSDYFETFMKAEGLLYYLWVIPYGIATALLGLLYLRFLWRLPSPIRKRFVVAGIIFLTGALGFDMLGGREADAHGVESVTYCALYTVEEFLEMLGVILFLSALLIHLCPLTVKITGAPKEEADVPRG